jgi:AcrR family transcriptional regulator
VAEVRIKRRKRMGDEARSEALIAARDLLLSGGPSAVTLASIGDRVGISHATIIHHFGSAAELQSALMASMIKDLKNALDDVVVRVKSDGAAPRRLVDEVFDAFDRGGAGQLAAWLAVTRNFDHLNPVRDAVHDLIAAVSEKLGGSGDASNSIQRAIMLLGICAFGDAVIGPHFRGMIGQDDDAMRDLTAKMLPYLFIQQA